MRRIAAEIREETGLTCSIGISENRHAGEDHQRAGQARRPRRALAGRGAGALRRRLPRPGAGDRAEDRRQAGADGDPHAGRARRAATRTSWRQAFGPRTGGWLRRRARLRGRDAGRASSARPSRSRPRSPSTSTSPTARRMAASIVSLAEELCRRLRSRGPARAARSGSRSASTTGPTSPARARVEEPTDDPALVGEVALDLLRAYSPPRPVRLLGVRVAQFGEGERRRRGRPGGAPDAAQPPRPGRASGSRARRRGRGSAAAPWSPRSGRSRGRRRRGRGRRPAR